MTLPRSDWPKIDAEIRAGIPPKEIASHFPGLHYCAVYNRSRNVLGIVRPRGNQYKHNHKHDWIKHDALIRNENMLARDVSKLTGIPIGTIWARRQKLGVTVSDEARAVERDTREYKPAADNPVVRTDGVPRDKPEKWVRWMMANPYYFLDEFGLPARMEIIQAEAAAIFGAEGMRL